MWINLSILHGNRYMWLCVCMCLCREEIERRWSWKQSSIHLAVVKFYVNFILMELKTHRGSVWEHECVHVCVCVFVYVNMQGQWQQNGTIWYWSFTCCLVGLGAVGFPTWMCIYVCVCVSNRQVYDNVYMRLSYTTGWDTASVCLWTHMHFLFSNTYMAGTGKENW